MNVKEKVPEREQAGLECKELECKELDCYLELQRQADEWERAMQEYLPELEAVELYPCSISET